MMEDEGTLDYLDLEDVLNVHVFIMESTDSYPQPLRSPDGLQSAINRAKAFAHYQGLDLIGQAARLGTGISRAQAFLEGNKRTAYAAVDAFLRLNGQAFVGGPVEFGTKLEELASPDISDDEADDRFDAWLRDRVEPIP